MKNECMAFMVFVVVLKRPEIRFWSLEEQEMVKSAVFLHLKKAES